MKKLWFKIILGIIASSIVMGLMFYFFLFLNPIGIYESNTLKWIPILIVVISLYISGRINEATPTKFLPFLFIPLILFKPFNFTYLPFILILIITGALILFLTRNHEQFKYRNLGWIGVIGIFLFFLFSQPLILKKDDFGYDDNGELMNANVIWDFVGKTTYKIPNHLLFDKNNEEIDIANITGEINLITFWATWCAPCIEEKPELGKFKKESGSDINFIDVSFDSDRGKWVKYLRDKEPKGIQLISDNLQKTSRAFNFAGLPMYIIVNEDGTYKKYRSFEIAKNVINKY